MPAGRPDDERRLDLDPAVVGDEPPQRRRRGPLASSPRSRAAFRARRSANRANRTRRNGLIPAADPSVEFGLRLRTFWAIETAGPRPSIERTLAGRVRSHGEPSESVSRCRRRASA